MRALSLRFSYLDDEISISDKYVRRLNISDNQLFVKMYRSLMHLDNDLIIFDDEYTRKVNSDIIVCNLPDVPFSNKILTNALYKKISMQLTSDIDKATSISNYMHDVKQMVRSISSMSNVDYAISEPNDILKLIKMFDITPIYDASSLLDTCISFLDFVRDVSDKMIVCFITPEIFLNHNQYQMLIDHAIFSEIPVIMLGAMIYGEEYENERKTSIDQQLWVLET